MLGEEGKERKGYTLVTFIQMLQWHLGHSGDSLSGKSNDTPGVKCIYSSFSARDKQREKTFA